MVVGSSALFWAIASASTLFLATAVVRYLVDRAKILLPIPVAATAASPVSKSRAVWQDQVPKQE